ncbi:hypothetical protein C8R43DRAFT_1123498 [Mycena crocata]|nr:hypothetical protein C8R43DRAFT_1123498 [Mycena crocata]
MTRESSSFTAFWLTLFLAILQPSVIFGVGATFVSETSPGLERRDTLAFWATQNWLQFMANTFTQDGFTLSDGVPKLQVIANHVKNCSDAFDSATIAIASLIPGNQFSPKISADDAATLNSVFVPSTQSAILGNLHTLLFGKAFFSTVNANQQMRLILCHWVGDLARQNDIFLSQISAAAPVRSMFL